MKTVLVALAVVFAAALPATVQAVEWKLLGQSDNNDTSLYYVEKSVKMLGKYVRLQTKRVYSSERGQEIANDMGFPTVVAFTVETQTLDCAKKRRAIQKITYYGQQGKILDRVINQTYTWQPFISTGLSSALCERLFEGKHP